MEFPKTNYHWFLNHSFRSTNADNIPGTGLGMAIIKLFVEMHGGEVSIESTINIGTILTITLPIGQQTTTLDE